MVSHVPHKDKMQVRLLLPQLRMKGKIYGENDGAT